MLLRQRPVFYPREIAPTLPLIPSRKDLATSAEAVWVCRVIGHGKVVHMPSQVPSLFAPRYANGLPQG